MLLRLLHRYTRYTVLRFYANQLDVPCVARRPEVKYIKRCGNIKIRHRTVFHSAMSYLILSLTAPGLTAY